MIARHNFPILAAALLCGASILALPGGPAQAQPTPEQQSALRANCRGDVQSHCRGASGQQALQCLTQNVAKLSPGCQTAVRAVMPAPPPAATASPPAPAASAPATAEPPPAAKPAATTPTTAKPATAKPATAKPTTAPAPRPARPAAAAPAAPAPAARPTAQQQAALRQSCQSDFKARCAGVQPGGTEALQCLQRNAAQLSPNCRSAVAAIGGRAPAAATPAAAAKPAPASALAPEQQQVVRSSCRIDFLKNCKGVKADGPQALACLKRNVGFVSPNCRAALVTVGAISSEAAAAAAEAAPPLPPGIHPAGKVLRRVIQKKHLQEQGQ